MRVSGVQYMDTIYIYLIRRFFYASYDYKIYLLTCGGVMSFSDFMKDGAISLFIRAKATTVWVEYAVSDSFKQVVIRLFEQAC